VGGGSSAVSRSNERTITVKSQHFVDTVAAWLQHHALSVTLIVVVTIVVLKVAAVLNRRLVARLFAGKQDEDSQKVAHTVTRGAHWVVMIALLAVALSVLLNELGLSMERVFVRALDWLVGNGLGIAIILAMTFVALKVAGLLAGKLVAFLGRDKRDLEAQKRADTLSSVIRWVLRTGIMLLATVMLLGQLGVQIGPILAAAGVVGLAVGFGAQNVVQDVISGFFLLLEDQVRVGDVVQLNDKAGLVEKITLRMVILRDFSGSVHYIRNGKIDVVTNMTKEYSYAVFEIGVAYREDTDEACAVIEAVGKDLQQDPAFKEDILAPLEVVGVDKFADSAVILKARFKTKPSQQWRVGREFNRRLKKKFDEQNIEMPFPHVTLYPGKGKQGDSPSLKVEVPGGERKTG
jgi:moderate conductance mechanosensitive channel